MCARSRRETIEHIRRNGGIDCIGEDLNVLSDNHDTGMIDRLAKAVLS
jgi:hypothetical protein